MTVPSTANPTPLPDWLIHLVATVPLLLAVLLIVWHPNHTLAAPAAQAAVLVFGMVIFAGAHLVKLISENGLTKAGLLKSVSEEEAELKSMWPAMKQTFEAAKPALDLIPGVPQALAAVQSDVQGVKSQLADMPAAQRQAVVDVLAGFTNSGNAQTVIATPGPQSPQVAP